MTTTDLDDRWTKQGVAARVAAAQEVVAADRVVIDTARREAESAGRRGEDLVKRVDQVGGDFRRRVESVEADGRLSADAKAGDVAKLKGRRNAEVAALHQVYEAQLTDRRDVLRRKLCSPPTPATSAESIASAASFRGALERAGRTDPRAGGLHPLADLMHQARLTEDGLLERAVLVTALDRNDEDVLRMWIDAHPTDAEVVEELHELQHELTDRKARFGRSLTFARI